MPSPPSSTLSLGLGSISTSISTLSLTLMSTLTLPFSSHVTATPPFFPAYTPGSPALGFDLCSMQAQPLMMQTQTPKRKTKTKMRSPSPSSCLLRPLLAISICAIAAGMQISSYNINPIIIHTYGCICCFIAISVIVLIGCPSSVMSPLAATREIEHMCANTDTDTDTATDSRARALQSARERLQVLLGRGRGGDADADYNDELLQSSFNPSHCSSHDGNNNSSSSSKALYIMHALMLTHTRILILIITLEQSNLPQGLDLSGDGWESVTSPECDFSWMVGRYLLVKCSLSAVGMVDDL
ncbi:hypothetical protein CVT25_006671 [Psilocybe cyanescens]|uniref:Uncharacterized protein n=1 Tax=Psilocybe cyanescens TaxID=93625 RepID=A0A409W577_PSICY|nr:hypothetical protein CVT25_006671 [Psilocybe cyanescens]